MRVWVQSVAATPVCLAMCGHSRSYLRSLQDKRNGDTGNIRGQIYDRSSDYTAVVTTATNNRGMICCTEPGLPEVLYMLYIYTFNNM
jgi:hypothetical protein